MSLGERVREFRKKSGMSQDKVAELIGISRQAVAKWESDKSSPNTENLFKLAEIFGTTVDMLTSAEKEEPVAEQVYNMIKSEQDKKKAENRIKIKGNLIFTVILVGAYILMFLIMQFAFGYDRNSSMMEVLFGSSSRLYLWGWLVHQKIFFIAAMISIIPSFFGKRRFTLTTSVMIFAGILIGELFGPYPSGEVLGHDHYGWAIWILIYLSSIVMGIIAEHMKSKGIPLKSKQSFIWFAATVLCCIASVIFVIIMR